jgi:hypothetical protein
MKKILFILLLLLSGLLVYWFFDANIIFFKIIGLNHLSTVKWMHSPIAFLIRNYLPDFLWAMAVMLTAVFLQEKKIPAVYVYILFALPFISEVMQGFKIVPGTFDWYDLLVYAFVFIFVLSIKKRTHAKKV